MILYVYIYTCSLAKYDKNKKCLQKNILSIKVSIDLVKYLSLNGEKSLITIYSQAGFGFVEDGLCFHKGIAPTHKNRLILQIELFILMFVIFGAALDKHAHSNLAGLAIGLTVGVEATCIDLITPASMNPARSFRPWERPHEQNNDRIVEVFGDIDF